MIFKTYSGKAFSQIYFKFFFFVNLFLSFISLYGFISGAGISTTFAGIFFMLLVSLCSLSDRFRKNPLSSLFCFFTLIYLSIPSCFILFEGSEFLVGLSVGQLPFNQNEYQENRALGFLYLCICWISVWLAIFSINFKKIKFINSINIKINLNAILLMGFFVASVTIMENESFLAVKINRAEHMTSLIAFLLLDHAYLILAGVLLFYKINNSIKFVECSNINYTIVFIFITFVFIGFFAGSKGALLTVFVLLILYPFFLSTQFDDIKTIFIRPIYFLFLILIAPILYYLAILKRLTLSQGSEFDLLQIFFIVSEIQPKVLYDTVNSIFYRLVWGGLDQFLLLFKSYIYTSYDFIASNNFTEYLFKNTLNLLLPGTPFQEAYAPSSQLFPSVLRKENLVSEFDKTTLILSLNTQPYTIFGVFMIIFGIYSPIFLFLFIVLFSIILRYMKNILLKIVMLYFFGGALSSYAFESVIGATFNVLISLTFMYFIIKLYSKFYYK